MSAPRHIWAGDVARGQVDNLAYSADVADVGVAAAAGAVADAADDYVAAAGVVADAAAVDAAAHKSVDCDNCAVDDCDTASYCNPRPSLLLRPAVHRSATSPRLTNRSRTSWNLVPSPVDSLGADSFRFPDSHVALPLSAVAQVTAAGAVDVAGAAGVAGVVDAADVAGAAGGAAAVDWCAACRFVDQRDA